jgi:gluconokinase
MRILSIDIGTTNIKLSLVNISIEDYQMRFIENINVDQMFIKNEVGSGEHIPQYIISTVNKGIKHIVKSHGAPEAVALATYLFGLALMNRSKGFLTNIYTWADERAIEVVGEIKEHGVELYRRTGCPPIYIYALPKILWLRKHRKSIIHEADLYLDLKSIITNHFLHRAVTDMSSASGTYQMFNIYSLRWDDYALGVAGVDEKMLPEVVEADYVEYIPLDITAELNINDKMPLVIGLFDGASMIYGLTGGRSNIAVVNLGTSAMIRTVIEEPVIDNINMMRFQTYYFYREKWLSGGAINNAGIALDTLIDILASGLEVDKQRLFNELYNYRFNEDRKPLFLPLIYSERIPFLKTDIGGSIIGLKPDVKTIDIVASCIEGIAMLLKVIWEALEDNNISIDDVRIGGKLSGIPFVRAMLANLFNRKTIWTDIVDVSHLGNALLAATSLGYSSTKQIRDFIDYAIAKRFIIPEEKYVERYRERYQIFKKYLYSLYSL